MLRQLDSICVITQQKTASSSVRDTLKTLIPNKLVTRTHRLDSWRKAIDEDAWKIKVKKQGRILAALADPKRRVLVITVVRDPVPRLKSEILYRLRDKLRDSFDGVDFDDPERVAFQLKKRAVACADESASYAEHVLVRIGCDWRSAAAATPVRVAENRWWFVMRMARLNEDWDALCDVLGLKRTPILHTNPTGDKALRQAFEDLLELDEATIARACSDPLWRQIEPDYVVPAPQPRRRPRAAPAEEPAAEAAAGSDPGEQDTTHARQRVAGTG